MKIMGILVFVLLFAFSADAKEHLKPKKISIDRIHPTQVPLGMLSIDFKIAQIKKHYAKGNFNHYLDDKIAPAIKGPDNLYYILDRHHTSYSIYHSDIPKDKKVLKVKVIQDWSDLSRSKFRKKMIQNKHFWSRDEHHHKIRFDDLPDHITQVKDDPYRSLAWRVRKMGGFKKVPRSFLEFYWGIFFKESGIILKSSSPEDVRLVADRAFKLARSKKQVIYRDILESLILNSSIFINAKITRTLNSSNKYIVMIGCKVNILSPY